MLSQSLAQQSKETREELQVWLKSVRSQLTPKNTLTLRLSLEEFDRLLHVFNDIRVGNWINLGSPDDLRFDAKMSPAQLRFWREMEGAGFFESAMLSALDSD